MTTGRTQHLLLGLALYLLKCTECLLGTLYRVVNLIL